jgi:hypothetical protein
MIEFNKNGFLPPDNRIYNLTVAELEHYFVNNFTSNTRKACFENYVRYSNELKSLLNEKSTKQWINGSFISNEPNPKDIDLVTFIDHKDVQRLGENLLDFGWNRSWKTFGVDAYLIELFPKDHKSSFASTSDIAYWMDHFGRTKKRINGKRLQKGFIEIFY